MNFLDIILIGLALAMDAFGVSLGIGINSSVIKTLNNTSVDIEVLKFINKNRPLELGLFYESLRKRYNEGKSKLYKEIVQIDIKEPKDMIVTLSSLLTQILLYSNKVENKQLFLKHSRADEITKVLYNYFDTFDLTLSVQMLNLIKADLKACELLQK